MGELAERMDEVQAKLLEIRILRKEFEKTMAKKDAELIHLALNFTSYWDLYKFGKAMSKNQEEFNLMMLQVRNTFFNK